jgi:hypothetical protein
MGVWLKTFIDLLCSRPALALSTFIIWLGEQRMRSGGSQWCGILSIYHYRLLLPSYVLFSFPWGVCTAGTLPGHEGRFPTLMGDYLDPVHAQGTGHHAVHSSPRRFLSLMQGSWEYSQLTLKKCDGCSRPEAGGIPSDGISTLTAITWAPYTWRSDVGSSPWA